jgi:hypothetical protein
LWLIVPSSGSSAISVQASTSPTPGIEVKQSVAMGKRGIGLHDRGQVAVEHVDVGRKPCDATPRKPLQHRIFQQSGGILNGNFLSVELTANRQHLGQPFDRGAGAAAWDAGNWVS